MYDAEKQEIRNEHADREGLPKRRVASEDGHIFLARRADDHQRRLHRVCDDNRAQAPGDGVDPGEERDRRRGAPQAQSGDHHGDDKTPLGFQL